jgi:acyl-[acyl-carrier-protein]-phospholipid O-acyltransferase/long-chain-fatty-acid--[acyl-carrier-protein] ligase
MDNQFILLRDKRFLPFFVTQFLGAFNDNLYKTAISVLVAYGLWDIGTWRPEIVVSLAAALFILPFILFAPLAGQFADKYDKTTVMRIIKGAELFIVAAAVFGIAFHSILILLIVLFAFGTHSAFFSPCKFAILPQHLQKEELIGGNALVNTGTYIAILLGNIFGSLLALYDLGIIAVCCTLFICAGIGFGASFRIPKAPPPAPDLKINWNAPGEAIRVISFARRQPQGIFTAMIGCSWFFFVGAMVLSQLPNYCKQVLGVDNFVLTFFMIIFSVGVGFGGLINNRLLESRIEATFVPFAAFVLAFFAVDLYFASGIYHNATFILGDYLVTLPSFLSAVAGWRIVVDLLMISLAGGLYVVPLKAIIQHRTQPEMRARVIAAGSLLDASFILASSVAAIFMLGAGFAIEHLFLLLAAGSVGMGVHLHKLAPSRALRKIFRRQYE